MGRSTRELYFFLGGAGNYSKSCGIIIVCGGSMLMDFVEHPLRRIYILTNLLQRYELSLICNELHVYLHKILRTHETVKFYHFESLQKNCHEF